MLPPGETLHLFGSLYCTAIAAIVAIRFPHHVRFVRARGSARRRPRFLGLVTTPRLGPFGTGAVGAVLISSLAASVALRSSAALAVAAVAALLYFAQLIQLPEVRRKANTIPVILGLVSLSLAARADASPRLASALLLLIEIIVVQVYLSAGLAKLRASGLAWLDGRTLRSWLVHYHLRDGNRAALAFASSEGACRLASFAIVSFELTFWIVVPFPVLTLPYLAAAFAFHLATATLMRIHYWLFFGPAYLVFLLPLLRRP